MQPALNYVGDTLVRSWEFDLERRSASNVLNGPRTRSGGLNGLHEAIAVERVPSYYCLLLIAFLLLPIALFPDAP